MHGPLKHSLVSIVTLGLNIFIRMLVMMWKKDIYKVRNDVFGNLELNWCCFKAFEDCITCEQFLSTF